MKTKTRRPDGEFFPSARDPWLGAFLWAPLIGIIPLAVLTVLSGPGGLAFILIMLASYGLIAWIWFGTGYTIGRHELIVQSGPLRWRVKLSEIEQIEETKSLLSSAALSRDRLKIRYRKFNTIYISPKDKERFLERMAKRCPKADIVRSAKA